MPAAARLRRTLRWTMLAAIALYAALIGLRVLYPIDYVSLVRHWSIERGLNPALVAAMVRAESRFHADAVSPKGAIGLMQIMPETGIWIAEEIGIDGFTVGSLVDPETSLRLGTWYFATLVARFEDLRPALQAYNAGPTRAEEWLDNSEAVFAETKAYVDRVLQSVRVYRMYLALPWLIRAIPQLPL